MDNDIETLFDDRNVTFGVKFKDSELLGVPIPIIIGKSFETTGEMEVKLRGDSNKMSIKKEDLIDTIKNNNNIFLFLECI